MMGCGGEGGEGLGMQKKEGNEDDEIFDRVWVMGSLTQGRATAMVKGAGHLKEADGKNFKVKD